MKKQLLILMVISLGLITAIEAQSVLATFNTPVTVGSTLTVNYTYTAASSSQLYIAVVRYDDWTWDSEIVKNNLSPAPAGTNVTGSKVLSIPSGTTTSASLTGNFKYRVVLELKSADWSTFLADHYSDLTINSTASSSKYDSKTVGVYPNPVETSLKVTSEQSLDGSSFSVYNVLGKEVIKNQFTSNSAIDVNNLASGFYFLKVENLKPVKFLKK